MAKRSPADRKRARPYDDEATLQHADLIRARRLFESDAELATALGVSRSSISAWRRGDRPNYRNRRLLAQVAAVAIYMEPSVLPRAIGSWLVSPQFELGQVTPLETLRAGRCADVVLTANALIQGSYI